MHGENQEIVHLSWYTESIETARYGVFCAKNLNAALLIGHVAGMRSILQHFMPSTYARVYCAHRIGWNIVDYNIVKYITWTHFIYIIIIYILLYMHMCNVIVVYIAPL